MNNDKLTILYERLSHEDGRENESLSIEHQENINQGGFHPKDEIPPINWKLFICLILKKLPIERVLHLL